MCRNHYQQELQRQQLPTIWEIPDDMWHWIRSLFPPEWVVDSPQQAAQRILEATASEEKWQQVGSEASEHVIGRWDWPRVRSLYEDLLRGF